MRRARVVDEALIGQAIQGSLDLIGLVAFAQELLSQLRAAVIPTRQEAQRARLGVKLSPGGYLISLWIVC
ncbi:MAG: hypothetical protein H6741_10270 [Alphaproteobacteria bacterium]|nr:hypothetical protein [Alphaproteobacteria bacterium]